MILNTSPISLAVSITSGKYSATFCMSLQLLTPSELGDRSIFVPGEHVRKWELKINAGGYQARAQRDFCRKCKKIDSETAQTLLKPSPFDQEFNFL